MPGWFGMDLCCDQFQDFPDLGRGCWCVVAIMEASVM